MLHSSGGEATICILDWEKLECRLYTDPLPPPLPPGVIASTFWCS